MQTQAEASATLVSSAAHQEEAEGYRNAPAMRPNAARMNVERQDDYIPSETVFHEGDEYRHEAGEWRPVPQGFIGLRVPQGVRVRREFQF